MAKKQETNEQYFLKIVMYLILGLIWVQIDGQNILPLGLVLGLIFAQKDHFSIDRKIEYVVLLFAAVLSYVGPGLFLNLDTLGL
jgi:hypothetical protein